MKTTRGDALSRLRNLETGGANKSEKTEKVGAGEVAAAGEAQKVAAPQNPATNEAGGTAAKQALRALAMDVRSPEVESENKGSEAATLGARLMEFTKSKTFKRAGSIAVLGLSLMGTAQTAMADTVYMDFNNGVKEIETARQLAQEIGDDFHLVRPTEQALEELFQKAENGEVELNHLILSGHSIGTSIWGSGPNGESFSANIDFFKQMKEKYPKAFDQVEMVHFMSCYSGSEGNSAEWNQVFHNARSIVGFYGSGPASHRPASSWVLKNTTHALRNLPDTTLSPQAALIKAKQISSLDGPRHTKFGMRLDGVYHQHGKKTSDAELVLQRVQHNRNQVFQPYFEAGPGHENTPTNHQVSPLRDYYNQLQDAVNVVEPGSSEAAELQTEVATTIRLIYFDNIAKNIQSEYGPTFAEANQQLQDMGADFSIGDVSKMTRREALDLAAKMEGLGNVDLASFVADHGSAVTQLNDFFDSRDIDFKVEMPEAGSSDWEYTQVANNLENTISNTHFTQAEKDFAKNLSAQLKDLRDASKDELTETALADAGAAIEGARDEVTARLEDTGSTVALPSSDASLSVEQVLELAGKLRSEAEGMSWYEARDLKDLAAQLDRIVGESGSDIRDVSVERLLDDNGADIRNLNGKLELLGSDMRVPESRVDGDQTFSAEDLKKATDEAADAMAEFEAPPADILELAGKLSEGLRTPPETSLSEARHAVVDGLKNLSPDVVTDNMITD
jgi:hypothetical protein